MKQILYIEDDQFINGMYTEIFQDEGYLIDSCLTGTDGLEKLKSGKYYDLVVSGIMLPGIDGLNILKQVKNENIEYGTYVILTNLSDGAVIEEIYKRGADLYLSKSTFEPTQVINIIKTLLNDFKYQPKQFFMSRAEHELFDVLIKTVGEEFYIFPQVHLPSIVDHKVKGQSWRGAFRHIDEKSVDFVLIDKKYLSPKLVIELDDSSHEKAERKARDIEVERILKEAQIPIVRINNHGNFKEDEIRKKINDTLQND